MTTQADPKVSEAERLAAYLRSHGHDSRVWDGALAVVGSWLETTAHGATYESKTWVFIDPNQIAVDEWLLKVSN